MTAPLLFLTVLLLGFASASYAAGTVAPASGPTTQPAPQFLWPEGAPLAKGAAPADKPAITVHLPPHDKATGAAVVICPGGGYQTLMLSYEGHDIAKWLNSFGIAGIVLKYRIKPYTHPAPLLDAQRALRMTRANAKDWDLNPDRIGIIGFSAGGHLAATAETHFDPGNPDAKDPINRVSSKPNFALLVYPVITTLEGGKLGCLANILPKNPDPADIRDLSNDQHVTDQTPPTFIVHSKLDQMVPVEQSRLFVKALEAHKVPVHFLELPTGGHGLGAGKGPEWELWQQNALSWLQAQDLARKTTPP